MNFEHYFIFAVAFSFLMGLRTNQVLRRMRGTKSKSPYQSMTPPAFRIDSPSQMKLDHFKAGTKIRIIDSEFTVPCDGVYRYGIGQWVDHAGRIIIGPMAERVAPKE